MKKVKQIIAIVAIVLLLGLYIATFITAIFFKELASKAFAICLVLTVIIPIFAYILILFFGRAYGKRIIGDPDPIIIPEGFESDENVPDENVPDENAPEENDSEENDSDENIPDDDPQ